jgi:hypothetical protein
VLIAPADGNLAAAAARGSGRGACFIRAPGAGWIAVRSIINGWRLGPCDLLFSAQDEEACHSV